MHVKLSVVVAFVFIGLFCVSWASINMKISIRSEPQSPSMFHQNNNEFVEQSTATNSNARLRLLADYARSTVDNNYNESSLEQLQSQSQSSQPARSSQTLRSNSIPATVATTQLHQIQRRSTLAPTSAPSTPTRKISESPVLIIKNVEAAASASVSVYDYASQSLLSTLIVSSGPSEVLMHEMSSSAVYNLNATVVYNDIVFHTQPIVCTENAIVVITVHSATKTAQMQCDMNHQQPATVTVRNTSPDDAQITIVDAVSGETVAQSVIRQGGQVQFKEGNPNMVFVAYARIGGINWRPAACNYRGTITISGSRRADGGVHLSCDEGHRAQPVIRIINGSGQCPAGVSIVSAESGKSFDEFSINCGATAESFIGATENSSRRISVQMADGSRPSMICRTGSTVLIGGSGIHC